MECAMTSLALAKTISDVPVTSAADLRALTRDASIATESALLAAGMIAAHQQVESISFERMVDLLQQASEALCRLTEAQEGSSPTVIFPCRGQTEAYLEQHQPGPGLAFRIHQDGAGRCSIGIYRLVGYL
jgi:hypothetical protein